MTIIKLLKPFEKALENRRFNITLYLLTSIILAPVAVYLEHIGLRPVHIIWCIWLLIIPVTYGIYFVWSSVTENGKKEVVNMNEHQQFVSSDPPQLTFYDKNRRPIEQEVALSASKSGVVPASLQAEFPRIGAIVRFRFLGQFFVVAELMQLEKGQSVVLEIDSKQFSLPLQKRRNLGHCGSLGLKVNEDKWNSLANLVRNAKGGVIS